MKNAAGRTGMGCVMGSKNLKTISARGTMDVEFAYPDKLLDYCSEMNNLITSSRWGSAQSKWGTLIIYSNTNTTGLIRTRNFQLNLLEDGENLEPEVMDEYTVGMSGCYGCSIHCRHRYVLKDHRHSRTLPFRLFCTLRSSRHFCSNTLSFFPGQRNRPRQRGSLTALRKIFPSLHSLPTLSK